MVCIFVATMIACSKSSNTPEPKPGPSNSSNIPVTSVSVTPSSATLEVGGSINLSANVLPANATDPTVTWSTSNSSVVTVNQGKVSAIAEGTATITAKAGNNKGLCSVTVKKKGFNGNNPEGFTNGGNENW